MGSAGPTVAGLSPRSQIRIGTSGWHYPTGEGTWDGIFYPPRGRRNRPPGFDELEYYAEHFDTVEVNSTIYGVPRRSVTESWANRTPDQFEFAIKLYQQFTHPKMYATSTGSSDTRVQRGDIDRFCEAIAPIHESRRVVRRDRGARMPTMIFRYLGMTAVALSATRWGAQPHEAYRMALIVRAVLFGLLHVSGLDFRLRPGSAAVDRGMVLPSVTDGFTGSAPDLGALEVGGAAPHYGPRD